ncbi:MAG: PEP-CTERM sorting domain-containing protein [Burkholderiaceae bacterium]|nr:PEP-CTERM sorting domain-containing protein [Burkholderiaceae bacterium]
MSGRLLTTPIAPGAGGDSCLSRLDVCDIMLQADQDIEFIDHANPNNVLDLGRLLCIFCVDQSVPAASLSLLDDAGNPLFFSDVRDFPKIPTVGQILDSSSPFYDERLAASQYFDREVVTPAESPRRTPEPATLVLFGSGFMIGAAVRRRQPRR